jgi:hypothetical protein
MKVSGGEPDFENLVWLEEFQMVHDGLPEAGFEVRGWLKAGSDRDERPAGLGSGVRISFVRNALRSLGVVRTNG